MKRLHTHQEAAQWLHSRVSGVLHTDSRRVQVGDGFVAWPGGVTDGRAYVAQALQQGASACLVEYQGADQFDWSTSADSAMAAYDGLKAASGPIAAAYYEQPSRALDVVAITGTNGKTSTAWWLAHALGQVGQRCAMVGTLGVGEVHALEVTGMTTPDPVLLQARLRDMVAAGVDACAIEASSIGLAEHRLDGTHVRVAMFTNFTQDHLDYHGNMASYWQAKAALFDSAGLQAAVVNVDDAQGVLLATQLQEAGSLSVWTVSCDASIVSNLTALPAKHLQACNITHGHLGLSFDVVEGLDSHHLDTRLVGHYNISNVLGVLACLRAMGHSLADAVQACAHLPAVPGRMQALTADGAPLVVVDYAHTPDAVAQAVQALLPLAKSRGGDVTCVLGCGGDRDAAKRPLMAAAAEQWAQHVVLTSDNPRSENPLTILNSMLTGLQRTQSATLIVDRAQAIAHAVANAQPADVVLIAGKGHEDYQEVMGVKHPFSDVAHAQVALAQRSVHV
ncbi:UDP-N-acetylmuramoyl-L-alanyl-D-glutamate--2,6-diaminopimelate ligase [Limnohabitans sp. B9-3]|uniref:UDP-N-acetylmuramoyl-L-alanyl-D-glutamate--2, 6-diaminopimelate ligase n=1 Tax=Limnohabitans sp. B9-3 TaxID=1100707 RepID=UPI000C1DD7FC|nr:UDP-N-acetylmuramoyl-L-alanyl-D-glutamate--2,6-diaminopimelate ligase [Limnohabitans sp. B9-3]PIT71966.1 UDP-N-acetylmuramoyl-L-alanyl-D-glutamate--2,6-diaminopimelate ligase [Limnohabitans sp. B9-3]